MTTTPLVYVAGPLFDEGERWFVESIDAALQGAGYRTFLPHRDNPPKTAENVGEIYLNDRNAIDACAVIVANLNGIMTDDGTAWELGYAFALGKPSVGLFSDWRARFDNDNENVNLMIECSLDRMVDSIGDLVVAVAEVLPQ